MVQISQNENGQGRDALELGASKIKVFLQGMPQHFQENLWNFGIVEQDRIAVTCVLGDIVENNVEVKVQLDVE